MSTHTIFVGLDGTLSHQSEDASAEDKIGDPVKPMLERVRKWIADGKSVMVFTARAETAGGMLAVRFWLDAHDLQTVGVTDKITRDADEIWSCRAVGIMLNKGVDRETLLSWHLLRVLQAAKIPVTSGVQFAAAADAGAKRITTILQAFDDARADIDGALEAIEAIKGQNPDDDARNVRHAVNSLTKAVKAINRTKE